MARQPVQHADEAKPLRHPWVVPSIVGFFVGLVGSAVAFIVVTAAGPAIENFGRMAPPRTGFIESKGALLSSAQEHLSKHLIDDPRFVSALALLQRRSGFRAGIRLDKSACYLGLQQSHWDPQFRTIELCMFRSSRFEGALRARGDHNSERTAREATLFVLLHEIAHAFISDKHLPILGREEDAADEIATFLAIQARAPAIAESGAKFFESEGHDGGASDVHVDPARRAFRIRCLLYGSPEHDASLRDQRIFGSQCRELYQVQVGRWESVLNYSINQIHKAPGVGLVDRDSARPWKPDSNA
jgi:Putative metallopeptidase